MKWAPKEERRRWFLVEGTLVGATAAGARTVHCGRVSPVSELGLAYSMSPLCGRYRKADGTQLARHRNHGVPMLVRNLHILWTDYVHGVVPTSGRPLCKRCISVWQAEIDSLADLELAVLTVPDSAESLS